ncbi:hypothetical protein [Cysteiniphilum halobium]|uniref:hypothetical protein n=1 Tax=Cysteiniphilum halobium TaxID=2219059 RepID=UPI003F85ACE1
MSDFIKLNVWDPNYSVGSQELTIVLNVGNISHFSLQEEEAIVYLNSGQAYNLTIQSTEAISKRFLDEKLLEPKPIKAKDDDDENEENSYLTQAAKKVYKTVVG